MDGWMDGWEGMGLQCYIPSHHHVLYFQSLTHFYSLQVRKNCATRVHWTLSEKFWSLLFSMLYYMKIHIMWWCDGLSHSQFNVINIFKQSPFYILVVGGVTATTWRIVIFLLVVSQIHNNFSNFFRAGWVLGREVENTHHSRFSYFTSYWEGMGDAKLCRC